MKKTDFDLGEQLLLLQNKYSNLRNHKRDAKTADEKDVWQKKINAVLVDLNGVKQLLYESIQDKKSKV